MKMPVATPNSDADQLQTQVDDETYEELTALAGQRVLFATVWEDSLADALAELPAVDKGPSGVDLDLYLQDGVYFELYGAHCYPDLDAKPIGDQTAVERHLASLVGTGLWLGEVAVDEDDGLVLVLTQSHQPILYLQVGAWILNEWEELPEGTAP
jgi:hypothetical protein